MVNRVLAKYMHTHMYVREDISLIYTIPRAKNQTFNDVFLFTLNKLLFSS